MKLYSTKEFALLAGVSIRTLKYWRKSKKLEPVGRGAKGAKFYSEVQLSEVQKYVKGANCTSEISGVQNEGVQTKIQLCTPEKLEDTVLQEFEQKFENMPVELTAQPRFFKVGADKKPLITEWSNPQNQTLYSKIKGFAGFDCSGHGTTDYIFFDFDHILNTDGTFINETAEEFVAWILDALGGYCELSISRTGLHMFAVPSEGYAAELPVMAGGRKASYYFTDERGKDSSKLEIFYRTEGRYCLLTGNLYECDAQSHITRGELADNAIKSVLTKIEEQIESEKKAKSAQTVLSTNTKFDSKILADSSEYDSARTMAMLNCIDVSQLADSDWLAFISACKNIGISYNEVDAKNMQDSARYNEQENFQRWNSLNNPSYDVETLHGLAKRFGYVEKDFWHEWHLDIKISRELKFSQTLNQTDRIKRDNCILSAPNDSVKERADFFMGTDTTVTKTSKNDLFTLKEAANYIGVNEKTLRRWNKQKIFEPYLIDHHGDFFYTREELEQLKSVYSKARNKTYSNVRTMSAGQNVKDVRTMSAGQNVKDVRTMSAGQNVNSRHLSKEDKFALFSLPHTDLYNAERIALFHGKHIRFLTDSHKWYIYRKNIWNDSGKENSAILPFCRDLSNVISANVDSTNPIDENLAKSWQKRKTFSNAIEVLKGVDSILITEDDLNRHKNLLNCKNGVVDLETGKLYPHDYKLLLTQMINADFRAGYHNDRVDKFLSEVLPDEETLQALLRFLGYCLTGEISEEKALFIHGRGGNGKSVMTKTLLNLFGDYSCGFPIESILTQPFTKDADAATPAFSKLQWRRLAIAEEIPSGRKLDFAKFKILTGGDALPIRKLHQEATEIKDPVHKLIFSGNHLPELNDAHDAGILRRWLQIKFEQDFTKNPDTTLKKFLQTDDALSALLNILVENAVTWYKDGLIISDKMEKTKTAYFAANDFISEFISEFCNRDNSGSISRKEFLRRLKAEYPNETRGKSDQELTSSIVKIDGIGYRRGGKDGGFKFFGVSFRDGYQQENLSDDFLPPEVE